MVPLNKEIVPKELEKMLDADIIAPSSLACSFPMAIVSKNDGRTLFSVDHRKLNYKRKADR